MNQDISWKPSINSGTGWRCSAPKDCGNRQLEPQMLCAEMLADLKAIPREKHVDTLGSLDIPEPALFGSGKPAGVEIRIPETGRPVFEKICVKAQNELLLPNCQSAPPKFLKPPLKGTMSLFME